VNIPSLKYIVLASPFKSKIRVLQSVGRALRKHIDKVNGAIIYDIVDDCKYLDDHGEKRMRYYASEGHTINERTIDNISILLE
jgi:superfamily II DNA or RNA helicase